MNCFVTGGKRRGGRSGTQNELNNSNQVHLISTKFCMDILLDLRNKPMEEF
jgi:hypothetical protein